MLNYTSCLDAECFNKALKDIHPLALSYGTGLTAGATEMDEVSYGVSSQAFDNL